MESDAFDDAWLEAEMAKELAAFQESDEDEKPWQGQETMPAPVSAEASDGTFASSAMDALASYITSRDNVYGEMHRNLESDLEEVTHMAKRVEQTVKWPHRVGSQRRESQMNFFRYLLKVIWSRNRCFYCGFAQYFA